MSDLDAPRPAGRAELPPIGAAERFAIVHYHPSTAGDVVVLHDLAGDVVVLHDLAGDVVVLHDLAGDVVVLHDLAGDAQSGLSGGRFAAWRMNAARNFSGIPAATHSLKTR